MNIRPLVPAEFELIEATRRAYRAMWAKLKNVPDWKFDGSSTDIKALDFIDYEAGDHPEWLSGAAVIWGGVLVSTGAVSWAIGDDQHFVLTTAPDYPRALIFPYARVAEIENTSVPQFGKYEWLLEEAVLRLMGLGFDKAVNDKLSALVNIDKSESFFDHTKRVMSKSKNAKFPK